MTKTINAYIFLSIAFLLVLSLKISFKGSFLFDNIVMLLPLLVVFALGTVFNARVSNFILLIVGLFLDSVFTLPLGMTAFALIFINLLSVFHNQFVFLKSNLFVNYLFFIPTSFIAFLVVSIIALISGQYGFYIFKSMFTLYLFSILLYPLLLLFIYLLKIVLSYRNYGEE